MNTQSGHTVSVQVAPWKLHHQALSDLRREVFIHEQHVPDTEEWDGEDLHAVHFLATVNSQEGIGHPIGTARLLPNGKLTRMAVSKPYRHQGVGTKIAQTIIEWATLKQYSKITLDAQVHAIGFYRRLGFKVISDTFLDAGMAHQTMQLELKPRKHTT